MLDTGDEDAVADRTELAPKQSLEVMRRSDLAAMVTGYGREVTKKWNSRWIILGIGGMIAAAVLLNVAETNHWHEAFGPILFCAGWTALIASFIPGIRHERRLLDKYQFDCPNCGEAMLGRGARGIARAQMIVMTGTCPACGVEVFAKD